jgi:hypothetical protein
MTELSERQEKLNGFLRARLEINRSLGAHEVPYGGFVFTVNASGSSKSVAAVGSPAFISQPLRN